MRPRAIPHTAGRHVAMPLGGIGTGSVALCADGALRQWQLHGSGNHRGDLPGSFFALRLSSWEPPHDTVQVLQAPPAPAGTTATPMVTDDHVPAWQRQLLETVGGVRGTTFSATYPVAEVDFDTGRTVDVRLRALNPMVPLDTARSSLPTAMFTFTLTNTGDVPVQAWLGAAVQNPVGLDATTVPHGVEGRGYGGNTNRLRRHRAWTSLVLENPGLDAVAPGAGQVVLTCDAPDTTALAQWARPEEFVNFLRARMHVGDAPRLRHAAHVHDFQVSGPQASHGPSAPGRTWNGGLCAPAFLRPGETAKVRFALTWHFPNRYVDFVQFGPPNPAWGPTRFWLGNHYTTVHPDAVAVSEEVQRDWAELEKDTLAWTELLAGAGTALGGNGTDPAAAEHLAALAVTLRSPTCFRSAEGTFFGFEGVNGASTVGHAGDVGGSCPLNCTHVWNYAQAAARLFPDLERSMRDTELEVLQAPDGAVPHRVIVPTYLPQLWGRPIGGPDEPALDGMLGVLLKSCREVRAGAGVAWLERRWPRLVLLLDHVRRGWDPDATGILRGIQPSTHDIDLAGVNPYMGTLWLAALRATEEMARLLGDDERAEELAALFARGSTEYDRLLFNGEYYVQTLGPDDPTDYQWGDGCLSDQLIGQWWAHQLDLGHLLPAEHVRSALAAVVRHNLRTGFDDHRHDHRVFADHDDTGLLVCTWPKGGRPAVPTRYCDEVWTGTEYQVAAHCLQEGLHAEAHAVLAGMWARHDGRRRNPYNHVECGDHYVRALAGWSVLEAWTAQRWDTVHRELRLRTPVGAERLPVVLDGGWGHLARAGRRLELTCVHGEFAVSSLTVHDPADRDSGVTARGVALRAGESVVVGEVDATAEDRDASAARRSDDAAGAHRA